MINYNEKDSLVNKKTMMCMNATRMYLNGIINSENLKNIFESIKEKEVLE